MINDNNYCVILAGGKGMRLWPSSRAAEPKQFLDFFGVGKTLLQQTFERMKKIVAADHILVNTNKNYAHLVREQLPDLPQDNILVEPIHRNTAPSVAWATHRIAHINPNANVIITPADQWIYDDEAFSKDVLVGLDFVSSHDNLLAMGIVPTRPEPGYGYIQAGESAGSGLYKVKSFSEKPDVEFAKMFMQSGEFYWNTGLYLGNVNHFRTCLCKLFPLLLTDLDIEKPDFTLQEETDFAIQRFPQYPNMSLDSAVLEKSEGVYVMKCDFGWADIGTWHGTYEAMKRGENDNVVIDSDVMMDDCHNNIVKIPNGKLAVISGLDGYIVAEKDNVLLICKKGDSSALVRKYVNEVQIKKGDKFV